jgi:hypothetical protein
MPKLHKMTAAVFARINMLANELTEEDPDVAIVTAVGLLAEIVCRIDDPRLTKMVEDNIVLQLKAHPRWPK